MSTHVPQRQTETIVSHGKAHSAWQRAWQNVARLPQRTATSLRRLCDASYRLERQADRQVLRWLTRARRKELEAIPGMTSARTCRLLAFLVMQSPPGGDVVEIGAWMGKSTAWLVEAAKQCPHRPSVISIDPHRRVSWEWFCATVERFDLKSHGLQVHRALSHAVGPNWTRPISLLWVDGCHEYEAVRQDIADFAQHVVPGGWIVFDDAAGGIFPGVEQAISEWMARRPGFQSAGVIRHLAVFRRQA